MKITKNYLKSLIKEELERYEEVSRGPRVESIYQKNLKVLNSARMCCRKKIQSLFYYTKGNKEGININDIDAVIEFLASKTQYTYDLYMEELRQIDRGHQTHSDDISADRAERKSNTSFQHRLAQHKKARRGTTSALAAGSDVSDMEAE